MLFCITYFGPDNCKGLLGLLADTYIDPFAHITIREKELFGVSGSSLDYYSVRGTYAVDFRSDNLTSFESLRRIQLTYILH